MTEIVDEVVELIEMYLSKRNIELTISETDDIRDILDEILANYIEE